MKNTKKLLLGLGASAAVVTPIVATVSCSLFGGSNGGARSSRQFWNYQDYIQVNEDDATDKSSIKNQIDASYEYNEFGDLPEFKTAIAQGRAAAGIGSDYFNARLAEEGLIQKIDFSRLYGMTTDRSEWENLFETKYYTNEAWTLLKSIKLDNLDVKEVAKADKDLADGTIDQAAHDAILHDVDHDGIEDKLWEFMAPYFMQNKVIAVNLTKLDQNALKAAFPSKANNILDITSAEFDGMYGGKTYSETFTELGKLGVKNFTVNDYMRDNMMIGSETMGKFTSSVPTNNGSYESTVGKNQINSFFELLKNSKFTFQHPTSGAVTLETVAQPSDNENGVVSSEAALMYNGDALAAYGGGYSDDADSYEKQIRIIIPKNPSFMLDGFVISKDIQYDKVEMNRIYDLGRNVIFQGSNTSYKANQGASYTVQNNIYKNFDYVNYTAAFKSLYEFLHEGQNYFDGDDDKFIHEAPEKAKTSIDADHITSAISDDTTNDLEGYYEAKWREVSTH